MIGVRYQQRDPRQGFIPLPIQEPGELVPGDVCDAAPVTVTDLGTMLQVTRWHANRCAERWPELQCWGGRLLVADIDQKLIELQAYPMQPGRQAVGGFEVGAL